MRPVNPEPAHGGRPLRTLITALPPSRLPGAVPTAPVGRLVARSLLDAGHLVRALVPAAETEGWPSEVEVIEGSVTDPDATAEAFDDVDRVLLAGLVAFVPERLRELTNLLVSGPLKRVVVLSSHGSDFETAHSPETWQWLAFEWAMKLHGASWIHLRPVGLFGNALYGGYPITGAGWLDTLTRGEPVREFLPDVAYPFMDEADLAEIAARLLLDETTGEGRGRRQLDVAGYLSSAGERFARLNETAGGHHRLRPLVDEQEARTYWSDNGWPDTTIDVTLYAMRAFRHAPVREAIRRQVTAAERLLGRPPRTFDDWLKDHAAALTALR